MSTPATTLGERKSGSRPLNIALWIAQVVLFAIFAMSGVMKSTVPMEQLNQMVPWTTDVPVPLVRFIGVAELAGALGVLLPALFRIKPGLTPLAALGLMTIMILALGFHVIRGEFTPLLANPIGLGALAAFVAWGRSRKIPIQPRT